MSEPSSSPFIRPNPTPAPRKTQRGGSGRTVRLASDVYLKALPLARRCHVPLSKYLSALLRPLVEEEARELIASQTDSEASSPGTVFTPEGTTRPFPPL
jgi:hypothetical protein